MNEKQIARLIRKHDKLEAEMRALKPKLTRAIVGYSRSNGFFAPLRIEKMRAILGMEG